MDIFPLIVERIRRDSAVLDDAMAVLERWDARKVGTAHRRQEWRRLLLAARESSQGCEALISLLLDPSEKARRLKDFAHFAGVLSREERRKAFSECTYDH